MAHSDEAVAELRGRFQAQLRRREIQIRNQVESINRLLATGGSYSAEMKELQEALSEEQRKTELITEAIAAYDKVNEFDGKTFGASAADGLDLANAIRAALRSSGMEG